MPQAAALALFNVGAPLAIVNAVAGVGTAGALLSTVATTALVVGGSALAGQAFAPSALKPAKSQGQVEVQQPLPVRFFHYGRVRTSGPLIFLKAANVAPNLTVGVQMVKLVALSCRQIDAVEEFFLDEDEITLGAGSGDAELGFVGYQIDGDDRIEINVFVGSTGQTAYTPMVSGLSEWTSDHRLRGIAYVVAHMDAEMTAEQIIALYPAGHKRIRATIRANKLYDPRKDSTESGGSGTHRIDDPSTWEWADNAALCVLDWLTHEDGYAIDADRIDMQSFQAAADLDDESVDLKGGGSEARYRVATTVRLDEPRKQVLDRLLQARDGRLYHTSSGKLAMRGGEWSTPSVTIDADEQLAVMQAEMAQGLPALSRVNQLTLTAALASHGYVETDLEPWTKTDDADYGNGIVRRDALDLTQVPSNSQAQRLAKIYMARRNPKWVGEVRTGLKALDAIGEEAVTLSWDELDVPSDNFSGPFWVDEMEVDGTGCRLSVRSADPGSYDWDEDTEEQDPPATPEYS